MLPDALTQETGGEMTTRCILNLNKIDGEILLILDLMSCWICLWIL